MLTAQNFMFSCIISTNTVSSSDSFVISIASILLFIIIIAALSMHFPVVYILYVLLIPSGLLLYSYSSCMNLRSGSSVSIIFKGLYVADLECCRFIWRQLIFSIRSR